MLAIASKRNPSLFYRFMGITPRMLSERTRGKRPECARVRHPSRSPRVRSDSDPIFVLYGAIEKSFASDCSSFHAPAVKCQQLLTVSGVYSRSRGIRAWVCLRSPNTVTLTSQGILIIQTTVLE